MEIRAIGAMTWKRYLRGDVSIEGSRFIKARELKEKCRERTGHLWPLNLKIITSEKRTKEYIICSFGM